MNAPASALRRRRRGAHAKRSRVFRLFASDAPALLLFGKLLLALLTLISAPIVARAIGPDGRGETAAAIGLFYLLPVLLAFGLPLELRRQAATGDPAPALRTARLICCCGYLVSCAIAALCFWTLFVDFESTARWVATVGVAATPFAASWFCDNGILVGQDRYRAVFSLQVAQPTLYVVLIVVFWLTGIASTATVLIANISGMMLTFVLGLSLTRIRPVGAHQPPLTLLRKSARFAGSAIAESATNRIDQVLALPLLGAYQAGLYSVAATVAAAPMAMGQALGASYFGATARTAEENRKPIANEAFRVALAAVLCVIPAVGIIAMFAIPVVFGSDFAGAIAPMWICLGATGLLVIAYVMSMVLAASGKGWRMTFAQVSGVVVGVAALLLFGPILAALGAAVASVVSATVIVVILVWSLRLQPRQSLPRPRDVRLVITRILKPRAQTP